MIFRKLALMDMYSCSNLDDTAYSYVKVLNNNITMNHYENNAQRG